MRKTREPLHKSHVLSVSYGVCGKARSAGNVGTLPRGATKSTGAVWRARWEAVARALDCVGALEKVPTFPASAALPVHAPVPLSF